MKEILLIFGGLYGFLSVAFGAFGAHALKKRFNAEQLSSFETGVKYQMYHAIIIIICGFTFPFVDVSQQIMGWCFIIGVFLFSFSIYGLTLSSSGGKKLSWLGPITPLGGLLLLIGWALFIYNAAIYAEYL